MNKNSKKSLKKKGTMHITPNTESNNIIPLQYNIYPHKLRNDDSTIITQDIDFVIISSP